MLLLLHQLKLLLLLLLLLSWSLASPRQVCLGVIESTRQAL